MPGIFYLFDMQFIYFFIWLVLFALFFPLSFVLFIRELGRLVLAYILGVRVFKFVFGFGTKVFSLSVFNLNYSFYLFPLGAYLEMDSTPEISFQRNSLFRKNMVSIGGFITLFCFSILLSFSISIFFKELKPSNKPVIGGVSETLPAKIAGLEKGDKIVSINGEPVFSWGTISDKVSASEGKPIIVQYQRGEDMASLSIIPMYQDITNKYMIGIMPMEEETKFSFSIALVRSFQIIKLRILSYQWMFSKDIPEVIGPLASTPTYSIDPFSNIIRNNLFWILDTALFILLISLIPLPFISDLGNLIFYLLQSVNLAPANFLYSQIANRISLFILPTFIFLLMFIWVFR